MTRKWNNSKKCGWQYPALRNANLFNLGLLSIIFYHTIAHYLKKCAIRNPMVINWCLVQQTSFPKVKTVPVTCKLGLCERINILIISYSSIKHPYTWLINDFHSLSRITEFKRSVKNKMAWHSHTHTHRCVNRNKSVQYFRKCPTRLKKI